MFKVDEGLKKKIKKKGNKKMKKSVTTISRNPRKPAETYTHIYIYLSLAEKKFRLGRFETLMRFESYFYMEK